MLGARALCVAGVILPAVVLGPATVLAAPATSASPQEVAAFEAFVTAFRSEALRHDIPAALYDETFRGLQPDPTVAAMTRRQPEEVKPLGAYLSAQVTAGRIAEGKVMLARWRNDLDAVERRYGVPAALVVAIWGLETNYGAAGGSKDVIRSLATLAAIGYRPDLYPTELIAALSLLRDGAASRDILRGSWAGAMGQPQFMPSSFTKYAVDQDGDGRSDIWTSVPDALASIANFIHSQGWLAGQPWGFLVEVPAGFDMRISRASFAHWRAQGVRRADGAPLPAEGQGILYYPVGRTGPAFLLTENFEVIKTYNFSDAYALSVGYLADRIGGGAAIRASWPTDPPIGKAERVALQARLVALGYAVDNREGRISLALRDVIRKAQSSVGMVPDGNPSHALLQALGTGPQP